MKERLSGVCCIRSDGRGGSLLLIFGQLLQHSTDICRSWQSDRSDCDACSFDIPRNVVSRHRRAKYEH
ncbi:hypothetical protein A5686_08185 [Mycobacterium sp. E2479]|nr:hypothetical protein A5686_11430 [Mycobacterium sp. E2479]OBH54316.1 hypothetical protein A5686_08185 [Mycobacterium sp. E2479]